MQSLYKFQILILVSCFLTVNVHVYLLLQKLYMVVDL